MTDCTTSSTVWTPPLSASDDRSWPERIASQRRRSSEEWERRLSEAKRAGVPAFRVLHDRTLLAIAAARPRDEAALLAVPGIGPALLKRYGRQVLGICRGPS